MTTKRNKGFTSSDLVLPAFSQYHKNPKMLIGVKAILTHAAHRLSEDDYSHTPSDFPDIHDNSSKLATLTRPKIETIRANSSTFKRDKLLKDINSIPRTIFAYQRTIDFACEAPYLPTHEKQSSTVPQPSRKQIQSQSGLINRSFDEISYEQPWSFNENMQQKLSLEIWMPKATLDDDDGNTSRSAASEIDITETNLEIIPTTKSPRSSSVKTIATTPITNIERNSCDEVSSTSSESVVIPHVDQYEERMYSNESKEILRSKTIELPTSINNLPINTNSINSNYAINVTRKSSNPTMVSKFIQKYSLMKKTHQNLIQAKLQLQNLNNNSNDNPDLTNDQSSRVRLPHTLGSTPLTTLDYPTISVKKLLLNTSQTRSANNIKVLERCSTFYKSSHSDIYPQLRVFYLDNQRQPSVSALPAASEQKSSDAIRTLQRSKTLDLVLNVPRSIKATSYVSAQSNSPSFQCTTNESLEETPYLITKRSAFTPRSKQRQGDRFVIQNSNHSYNGTTNRE